MNHGQSGRALAAQRQRHGDRPQIRDHLVMAERVAPCGHGGDLGAQRRIRRGPVDLPHLREDRLARRSHRDRMPGAGALRDVRERVAGLDAGQRDDLVAVEDGEEGGEAEFVRDRGELGKGLGLQVVRDAGGEGRHPRPQRRPARCVADDEPMILERAQQAVGDRAVHREARGDVIDRERAVGEDLEDPDAAAERLRCGCRGHRRLLFSCGA